MTRSHWHPRVCRICGRPNPDGGRVSVTGLCHECGRWRMNENLRQLQARRGAFAAWHAYRLADAVWGLSADDDPGQP